MKNLNLVILVLIFLIRTVNATSQDIQLSSEIDSASSDHSSDLKFCSSDLISNGDFENFDSACSSVHSLTIPCPDPFNFGCIYSWNASHGSPEFSVQDHAAILGSVKTNGYVWGEGISQTINHPLDSGKTYLLIFSCRTGNGSCNDSSYLSVQFTNQHFNAGTCFEMLPGPDFEIPGSPFKAGQVMTSTLVLFQAQHSFDRIWFSHINIRDSVAWLKLFSVHLLKMDNLSASEIVSLFSEYSGRDEFNSEGYYFLSEKRFIAGKTHTLITNPLPKNDIPPVKDIPSIEKIDSMGMPSRKLLDKPFFILLHNILKSDSRSYLLKFYTEGLLFESNRFLIYKE